MNNTKKPKLFLTKDEVMELVPMAKSTFYRQVAEGKIPSRKIGQKILVPVSWLEDFCGCKIFNKEA